MKRLIFLSAVGVVAVAAILTLIFPSVVLDLIDLMPASLPTPPQGFDVRREGIEGGKVETVEYDSKAAGCMRKMCVYTPPGFSKKQQYPVLYLLHGSLADETSWVKDGRADAILDNLYADKKPVPMIVVMPNGNLPSRPIRLVWDRHARRRYPVRGEHFPVQVWSGHRASAGLSAGCLRRSTSGRPTRTHSHAFGVFIGSLHNCEQFEKKHQAVLKDLRTKMKRRCSGSPTARTTSPTKSCQDTLRLFDKYKIPYVYMEGKGFHNWETANDLFLFAPLLFRDMD